MSREVSHYVVTAHPPGGVLHTVKCNFVAEDSEVSITKDCIITVHTMPSRRSHILY
jgi:hypothetical protein